MKKLFTIMMALVMMLTLSQCKKQNEENEDNTAKVRISCTIPLNKDGKTDFNNILNGEVNWSEETERIYLAIPGYETIVVLTSTSEEGGKTLTFTGSVESGFLEDEKTYDVWYLGRSEESKLVDGKVTGSIETQSGDMDDLGYHHIAKATVTANGNTLTFNGTFKNQVAIVRLGEGSSNTKLLRGNAVIGTEYVLMYEDGEYKFNVTESSDAKISVAPQTEGESYVVVFPNTNNNVELISDYGKKVTFLNGINAGSMYTVGWENYEGINGYEYVDLGLPSGLKWAKYNVGANTPEAYGNYYAWGETEIKHNYTTSNSITSGDEMSGISGKAQYDAATANWESTWRMPTQWEMQELIDNCTWTWTQLHGVNGYNVTGANGKSIFLPAAGYYDNGGVSISEQGSYWTSTPTTTDGNQKANNLVFGDKGRGVGDNYRNCGRPVRPVCGGEYAHAEVTTAVVTNIKQVSALCGGNVTKDNGRTVTERGVCWSTSENPTIENYRIADVNIGIGEYTVEITSLTPATVYYVRAYAINEVGIISYGLQERFNTTEIGNNGYEYDFSNMGSHAVDLGLPSGVMWSDCNIGAEWAVEQDVWPNNIYGNYFMWACINSSTSFGKKYYPEYAKECDFNYSGDIRYDAATKQFGGNWRTPTTADFEELATYCTREVVTKDGITCMKFTSKKEGNNNSIYLPFGGCYDHEGIFEDLEEAGWYLRANYSASLFGDYAPYMKLTDEGYMEKHLWMEYIGSSVRPVIGPIPAED